MANTPAHSVESSLITLSSTSNESNAPKIHIRCSGSRSSASAPAVIFITGHGGSCLVFSTLQRRLAGSGLFSLSYDRLGVGRSDPLPAQPSPTDASKQVPEPRTATDSAAETDSVLQAAKVQPPYVVVSHSYGGVVAGEFLAIKPQNVVGMVFIDANSERSADRPISDPDLEKLISGHEHEFDYLSVVGLTSSHTLSSDEWDEANGIKAPPEGWTASKYGGLAEGMAYHDSCRALARHQLKKKCALGTGRVSVIQGNTGNDLKLVLDEVERLNAGDPNLREEMRQKIDEFVEMDESMQREQLQLAVPGNGRMIQTTKSGHHVHLTEPELVVQEIIWAAGA